MTAFNEIDSANFLVAELTTKSIGVGIEIGYAYTRKIPIIYLYKKNADYSTTASGSSAYNIAYTTVSDLRQSMEKIMEKFI